jgi:uncharacterized SAM-binding protein YcdF (DUF218 family)
MNEKFFSENHEPTEKEPYTYDAIIVLGGGLQKTGDKYNPTDYRGGDDFGTLGAGMRMVAAVELYLEKKAKQFVFTTGISEKNKSKFGNQVPTEASVYKEKFLRVIEGLQKQKGHKIRSEELETPIVDLEDKSYNTSSNIKEILQLIQNNGWNNIALVSSDYHIPRIELLFKQALEKHPELETQVQFIGAESFAKTSMPGKYDGVIERYYASDEMKKRIENEQKGVADIQSGGYEHEEFQLKNKPSNPNEDGSANP